MGNFQKFRSLFEARQAYKAALHNPEVTLEQLKDLKETIADMESASRAFARLAEDF